ncbi:hypothetical protein LEP1GSC161_0986 [Leptospira santarosai str. CBC1416]|uniref:Uncharacterized protein n=1 Tax=Leptospira santarosai str. CBC1416 TaxID=1193059 RepID=M6VMP4_9LEPT|nr:hypothetical protein LEP1GSC161_0986 [Leptospira santarosai str. CBC1416]
MPCSAYSKISIGTFVGIVIDLILPDTILLWIGIGVIVISIEFFLKKRSQIMKYSIFGMFLFAYLSTSFPEKFQKHRQKNVIRVSQKNPFGKPERIFQEKFRKQVLLELKEADLEKNTNRVALGLISEKRNNFPENSKRKRRKEEFSICLRPRDYISEY